MNVNDTAISGFLDEYRFLSNFWLANVVISGITFPSNEHAYQGFKSNKIDVVRRFTDVKMTPAEAKKLGKQVELRQNWNKIKVGLMYTINLDKFTRHEDLKKKLIETGDRNIIEVNTWGDTVWGVCNGVGENLLGIILMLIRGELRHIDQCNEFNKTKKLQESKLIDRSDIIKARQDNKYSAKEFIITMLEE